MNVPICARCGGPTPTGFDVWCAACVTYQAAAAAALRTVTATRTPSWTPADGWQDTPVLCHPVGAPDAACHGCGAPDRRTLDRDAPAIVEHGDGGYRVRAGLTRHPRVFGLLEVARRYAYAHNAANGHATTPADMRD